ncbi:MAG: hypothetical protein V1824_04365 [archaeon]
MAKIIISDSCSLILLEKCGILVKLLEHNKLIIPKKVYEETVVLGIERGYLDATNISRYIDQKDIEVKNVKKILNIKLNKGELEAVSLYVELNANLLITDDKEAMRFCLLQKFKFTTTPKIIIKLYKLKRIKKEDAIKALDIISKEGWYKSYILAKFYEKLRS